jgi:alginate O-acetyltransferase complex protein AlgJ
MKDAQDAGIEDVDLLPHLLKAKKEDAKNKEPVYQKQDTHWTNRGLEVAAQLISDRIKSYAWYNDAVKASGVTYTLKDTVFSRQGDIVERLPEADRGAYPSVQLAAQQVFLPDGTLYKANQPQAPVLLMGDSFTGVFELVDCKSAGVGSHIAAKIGLPVDIITSWGGGPLVRDKMLRGRAKNMGEKRVIIYMMVARDLYNYTQGWTPLPGQ